MNTHDFSIVEQTIPDGVTISEYRHDRRHVGLNDTVTLHLAGEHADLPVTGRVIGSEIVHGEPVWCVRPTGWRVVVWADDAELEQAA